VYALTTGKSKPKLKPSDGSAPAECQPRPPDTAFSCRNMTMEAFAATLSRIAGDYLTDPVVDSTGLAGAWDFDLTWNPRSRILPAGLERTTIFEAVDQQLVDETGLKGAYDFTISFTPRSQLQSAAPGGDASDPTGAISFFDALTRQLGLKLEMRKRPMPVLVIDHIEEKPSEN